MGRGPTGYLGNYWVTWHKRLIGLTLDRCGNDREPTGYLGDYWVTWQKRLTGLTLDRWGNGPRANWLTRGLLGNMTGGQMGLRSEVTIN